MKLFFLLFFFGESYSQIISGGVSGPLPTPSPDQIQPSVVISDLSWSSFTKTIRWEDDNDMENPIEDYENYINVLKLSQTMQNDDFNIYAEYVISKRDRLEKEMMEDLYDYWNNDLDSPSNFDRYQHKSDLFFQEDLNWERVQDDMNDAIKQWMKNPLERNDLFNHSSWGE